MEENNRNKVVAFDTLFTTNYTQMLKILITYADPSVQKWIAVYIKFLELQYTLSFIRTRPASSLPLFPHEEPFNAARLCDELLPLCSPSGQEQLKRMKNMCQNLENMQEMMQMMQMMKELFPEGMGPDGQGAADLFSGLVGMAGTSETSGASEMSEMSGASGPSGPGTGFDLSQLFELFTSHTDNPTQNSQVQDDVPESEAT